MCRRREALRDDSAADDIAQLSILGTENGREVLRVVVREGRSRKSAPFARSHRKDIEGMKQSLFFIATVSLTVGLSTGCCAQERATADPSREEWQARVKASRERLDLRRQELTRERNKQIDPRREELTRERNEKMDLMRRERKSMVPPPPTPDETAEAASRQVLDDTLLPGDIVSTKAGLFRFEGHRIESENRRISNGSAEVFALRCNSRSRVRLRTSYMPAGRGQLQTTRDSHCLVEGFKT
jgi:hypothetical protein